MDKDARIWTTTLEEKEMESRATKLDPVVDAAWQMLMMKSMTNAITGLSQMCDQHIKVTSLTAKHIPVAEAPNLLGGPEAMAAGVYIEMSGAGIGHIVIAYPPQTAFDLIDLLMGEPQGTTTEFEEMAQSVLGEVGNVMGSHFLNTISDTTGLDMRVSPPAVMLDMAAAILSAPMAGVMVYTDDTLVLDTNFGTDDRQINGKFLVMPNPDMQEKVMERLASR